MTVTAEFYDPDRAPGDPQVQDLKDPEDVTVWIFAPDDAPSGNDLTMSYMAGDDITRVGQGVYEFKVYTAPAAGDWCYEIEGKGADAVVEDRTIRVRLRRAGSTVS